MMRRTSPLSARPRELRPAPVTPLRATRLLGFVLGLLAAAAPLRASGADKRPRAPVVVTIVVDQLAAWLAAERLPLLPADGGFARLRRDGLWVREQRYAHSNTETALGHASLYTGAPPFRSGIVANELPPDPRCHNGPLPMPIEEGDSILLDPSIVPVSEVRLPPGRRCSASLARLRVETLADRLRAAHPNALIVSISLKDRGAAFAGGRRPDVNLWFDSGSGRFITSTAFAKQLPPWLAPVNRWLGETLAKGYEWTLEDPDWVKSHVGSSDDQAGEGASWGGDPKTGYQGIGGTFPHRVANPRTLRTSPLGDQAVMRAARAALAALPFGERPTLLALSFSAHDGVGHLFGPDSWEAWDELHRLDRALGEFLGELDQRFGPEGYAVLLTGDHGVGHMPEACGGGRVDHWERPCKSDGRRLLQTLAAPGEAKGSENNVETVALLRAVAAEVPGGRPEWIAGVIDPFVYLSEEARKEPHRRMFIERLRARGLPGVRRIFDTREFGAGCPPIQNESEEALVCRSLGPGASGDLYLMPAPGSFFDPGYARGYGVSHGTPYLYDRAVPLLVRAPGRVAPGVREEPVPFSAFIHTAARLLGIDPPSTAEASPELVGKAR